MEPTPNMIIFARQDGFGLFSTGSEASPVVLGPYTTSNPVSDIVDAIYEAWELDPDPYIDCLFLVGHGNAGVLWLGDGLGKNKSARFFPKLRECFSSNSRGIELHGCACASATDVETGGPLSSGQGTVNLTGGPGYDFLKAMASATGTQVTSSIDTVWGMNAAYAFDRRNMTVSPNGNAVLNNADSTAWW
jgi:hypothetical protein